MPHTPSSHPESGHEASSAGGGRPNKKSLSAATRLLVAALAGAGAMGAGHSAHADDHLDCIKEAAGDHDLEEACDNVFKSSKPASGADNDAKEKKPPKPSDRKSPKSKNDDKPSTGSSPEAIAAFENVKTEYAESYGINTNTITTYDELFKAIGEKIKENNVKILKLLPTILSERYGEEAKKIKDYNSVVQLEEKYQKEWGHRWTLKGLGALVFLLGSAVGGALGGRHFSRKRLANNPRAVAELLGRTQMDDLVVGHVNSLSGQAQADLTDQFK